MKTRVIGLVLGALSVLGAGCQPVDGSEADQEEVGEAGLAQVNPDLEQRWRRYTFVLENDARLADLLVIGDADVGGFRARTEYWFIETSSLRYLGTHDVEVFHESGSGAPPSPSGDQRLSQPVYQPWVRFVRDPVTGGHLYDGEKAHLRIKTESDAITRLTWYQTIPDGLQPENVTPEGTLSVGNGAVSAPRGETAYCIDAVLQ